ncbi:MAG: adenosylcobinamide-GDP ribazoletransferase [Coriobacteriia bacterium]|nr:adenosylcobinamide-GDP ribazoletransferase [Coriobacteriia bacterium]
MIPGLREAFGWLTLLPVRADGSADPVPWFSWVGAGLGAAAAGAAYGVARAVPGDLGALLAGVVVLFVWAVLTGMLHFDGLADTADALGSRGDRERRLAVLRDSRIGAFGASAVVLASLLLVSAGAVVISHHRWWVIAWAPVVARWGSSIALSTLGSARSDGLAATLARSRSFATLMAAAVPVAVAVPFLLHESPGALVAGLVVAVLAPRALARSFGGITGDLIGAAVIVTETAVLVAGALSGR